VATTLTEEVTWTNYGAKLQVLIGESPTGDALELLKDYLTMGAELGDRYLGRSFVDPPGVPKNASYGAMAYAKALWEWSQRPNGLKSVKTGQLAESYADPGTEAAEGAALAAAVPYWKPYKKDLSLAGALRK